MVLFASYHDFQRLEAKIDSNTAMLRFIASELGVVYQNSLFTLKQEAAMAATLADIATKSAAILASAQAETNAVNALTGAWNANQAQLVQLKADLDAALANGDPATIQTASDNLDAGITSINANDVAIAALTNTPAAAPSGVAPTTAPVAS
jgi:hypothetical protein